MIDKDTAKQIASKYYKEIYAYCLSYANCSDDEAYDITQDVFLIFQEKLDRLDNVNIRSWLLSTAKNKTREYFREHQKAQRLVPLNPQRTPTDDMFSYIDRYFAEMEDVSDEYIEKCKELILKTLSKKEYELYTKVFIEKKKYKQIAEELNTTEKNIGVRVCRLRQKIKTLVTLSLSVAGQIVIKLFLF